MILQLKFERGLQGERAGTPLEGGWSPGECVGGVQGRPESGLCWRGQAEAQDSAEGGAGQGPYPGLCSDASSI